MAGYRADFGPRIASLSTLVCIYCARQKRQSEFSLEHIWPIALGGRWLPELWQTRRACKSCNNSLGLFVDGAFIKSWAVSAERARDAYDYIDLKNPGQLILPLHYMGVIDGAPCDPSETVEFWLGPCGAHVLHFRPQHEEGLWSPYAGGKPGARGNRAGRAYFSATTAQPFWLIAGLNSFKAHFARAERFVTNVELPRPLQSAGKALDRSSVATKSDLLTIDKLSEIDPDKRTVKIKATFEVDLGRRFMAKVALGVGHSLFGHEFLGTNEADILRRLAREGSAERRSEIDLAGKGYFGELFSGQHKELLRWPGGWLLVLWRMREGLILVVLSPSGQAMLSPIASAPAFLASLSSDYDAGVAHLTVPAIGRATGPLPFAAYLSHRLGNYKCRELEGLEAFRINRSDLPPYQL